MCCRLSGDITVVDSYVDKVVAAGGYKAVRRDPPEVLFNVADSLDPGTGQVSGIEKDPRTPQGQGRCCSTLPDLYAAAPCMGRAS